MSYRQRHSRFHLAGVSLCLACLLYFLFIRPRVLHWGAREAEIRQPFPGDNLVRRPIAETTRAITIRARRSEVWPWLVQIGQGRGGFYSYDWLENLFGMDIHNTYRILPEHQRLQVGDRVPFWRNAGVKVIDVQPDHYLVLAGTLVERKAGEGQEAIENPVGGTWVFRLDKIDGDFTRLVVHSRIADFPPRAVSLPFTRLLLEPAHFVMERRMLIGIKRCAEGYRQARSIPLNS